MKTKEKIFIIGLIVLVVCIHFYAYRVWLFDTRVLTQGDWMLSLPNYSKGLFSLPMMWKSYLNGSIDLTPSFYIFQLLEGILATWGVSYAYIERITFMWPIAFLTIPFSYLFIRSFTKNVIGAFIGSLVYAYNTYFFIIQTGHLTLMTGFAFAPLCFLFFRYAIEKRSIFYAVLAGLIGFIISFYEFRAFYLIAVVAFFYYCYFLFMLSEKKFFQTIKETLLYALLPVFIVLFLNIYWILPLLSGVAGLDGTVFNRSLFGKEMFNISRASALFHPFWTGGKYFPFIVQPIPFYFFILPIFAFLGLYLNKKNKYIPFFGILALIGIFLAKQDNIPFASVYGWLYGHVPGFGAFREASKFYFFIALGYSVLIAAFFNWLWTNWKKGYLNILKYLLTLLIIIITVINTRPLITGEFDTLFIPRTMPGEYITLNKYIDKQNGFFRTLWVPVNSRWGTNTNLHPEVSLADTLVGIWKNYSNGSLYPTLGDQFIAFLGQEDSSQLLNVTSTRYVVVPLVDKANDDNFFIYFLKEQNDYVEALNNIPYLEKLKIGTNNIALYENKNYRPHIYTTSEQESVKKQIAFSTIEFTPINNTQYEVKLTNINHPIYLNFTDSFHPGWKIRIGEFNWFKVLTEKKYFLPDEKHFKNEAGLNSFFIDPTYIKQHYKNAYTVNPDGSMNLSLTLYFAPQSSMYLGVIISISVAVLLFGYLIIYSFTRYGKKH